MATRVEFVRDGILVETRNVQISGKNTESFGVPPNSKIRAGDEARASGGRRWTVTSADVSRGTRVVNMRVLVEKPAPTPPAPKPVEPPEDPNPTPPPSEPAPVPPVEPKLPPPTPTPPPVVVEPVQPPPPPPLETPAPSAGLPSAYSKVGAESPMNFSNALSLHHYCTTGQRTGKEDATSAVGKWLEDGMRLKRHLVAEPGAYNITTRRKMYSGLHMASLPGQPMPVFRLHDCNFSLSKDMTGFDPPYRDVLIENVAFDMMGTEKNFASTVSIAGSGSANALASHITLRGIRVFDSTRLGSMDTHRERQRQYLLVLACANVLIEDCHLSEGGRIKVGRPGKVAVIRRNRLHCINDNGITVVNLGSNAAHHFWVEDNHIENALAAGIFFGSDGQLQGTVEQTVEDVVILRNTILGSHQTAISGILPNHCRRVLVEGNFTRKYMTPFFKPDPFDKALGFNRASNSTLPVQDLTVRGNTAINDIGTPFGLGALFARGLFERFCITENDFRVGTNTAIRLDTGGAFPVRVFGNKLNGGGTRYQNETKVVTTAGTCWQP